MANARASYHAVRMSLQKLLGDVRDETLFNRIEVARFCYLWTFTTPDVCESSELLRRWAKFRLKCHKAGLSLVCFRVLEKHPKGHGWHIHFITVKRLDVRKIRPLAERSGFGRINVVRIPGEKAHYVVKYLVKALRKGDGGSRLWACVGFKGVRASDVLIVDTFWQEIFSGSYAPQLGVAERRRRGLERFRAKLFHREPNEPKKEMDNPKHVALAVERINKGEAILVGEYRATRVDTLLIANKQNPSQKEERVLLRHGLEIGNAQVTCVEWTPPGTSKDGVRLTLKKGQLVLVSVKKLVTEKGQTEISGELVPLS